MLAVGEKAPSFSLPDATTGDLVEEPWKNERAALAFFKTTCPVCQMVAPKLNALAAAGVPLIGVGQDPPANLQGYARTHGQDIPTLSEAPPYELSSAFEVTVVPTLFVVGEGGTIEDAVASWDRDGWNRVAQSLGLPAISDESDGLPVFRPG
jgi:peroxiredoxin